MIREPAVAGAFYPGQEQRLRNDVAAYLKSEGKAEPIEAFGMISPHAGYMYSGHVAGATFSRVKIPSKVIVLCPNHTGFGAWAAISSEGVWRTPLGNCQVDSSLAQRLKELYPEIEEDPAAHAREHSLEVQLPFLQELRPDFEFVPLCLAHFSFSECRALGEAMAKLIEESPDEILMVASSDMNHYESQERTLEKDQLAIDCILELNPEKLYRTVQENNITMCGIIPATCMLIAANQLGAKKATLVKHATSGDVSGDYSGVVGYAGIVIS